jgi:hypothetical protein
MASTTAREVGLICRWLLLGLTVAFCASMGWAILLSLEAISGGTDGILAFSDVVACPRKKRLAFAGIVLSPAPTSWAGLVRSADQPVQRVARYAGGSYSAVDVPPGQDRSLEILGLPYTRLALVQDRLDIVRLNRHKPLVLLDAAMVLDRPGPWKPWLQGKGDCNLALLYAGPTEPFARNFRRLEALAGPRPVLLVRQPGGRWPLHYGMLFNAMQRKRFRNCLLITDRPEQALAWATKRFDVLLLGPRPDAAPRSLRNVPTRAALNQALESFCAGT